MVAVEDVVLVGMRGGSYFRSVCLGYGVCDHGWNSSLYGVHGHGYWGIIWPVAACYDDMSMMFVLFLEMFARRMR